MIVVAQTALTLASLTFTSEGGVNRDLSATYKQVPAMAAVGAGTSRIVSMIECASICSSDIMCSGFSFFNGGADPTKNTCKFSSDLSSNFSSPDWSVFKKERKRGRYYGCFVDTGPTLILSPYYFAGIGDLDMTPTLCMDRCTGGREAFAALEIGANCLCGSTLAFRPNMSSACTSPCPGDPTKTCGGSSVAELYETGIMN